MNNIQFIPTRQATNNIQFIPTKQTSINPNIESTSQPSSNNVTKKQINIDKKMSVNQFITAQIKFLNILKTNNINLLEYVDKYKYLIIHFKPVWAEREFSVSLNLSTLCITTKSPRWIISSFIESENITGISYK